MQSKIGRVLIPALIAILVIGGFVVTNAGAAQKPKLGPVPEQSLSEDKASACLAVLSSGTPMTKPAKAAPNMRADRYAYLNWGYCEVTPEVTPTAMATPVNLKLGDLPNFPEGDPVCVDQKNDTQPAFWANRQQALNAPIRNFTLASSCDVSATAIVAIDTSLPPDPGTGGVLLATPTASNPDPTAAASGQAPTAIVSNTAVANVPPLATAQTNNSEAPNSGLTEDNPACSSEKKEAKGTLPKKCPDTPTPTQ